MFTEIPEDLPPGSHTSDDSNSDVEEVIEEECVDDYADDFEEYDSDEVNKFNVGYKCIPPIENEILT